MARKNNLGCSYQGHDFGAFYPDSTCIDGYLWDMDSGFEGVDGEHYLDIGGDIPCPQCNAKLHVKTYLNDCLHGAGYEPFEQPLTLNDIKHPLRKWPSNKRRMGMRFWRAGRKDALKDAKREGI